MYMRDRRKPYELSGEELRELIGRFEKITGVKFNDAFADEVNNFIGIMRDKFLIDRNITDNKKIKRTLEVYQRHLVKTMEMQNAGMDRWAHNHLTQHLPGGIDAIIEANEPMEVLLEGCIKAINELSGRSRTTDIDFPHVKQAMATELARELAAFGVKISATRGGIFEQCVREFYKAFNGEAGGEEFKIYPRDDLFPIIKKAKDDHTNPERFILLQFR